MSKIKFEELFPKYSFKREKIKLGIEDEELIDISFRHYNWAFISNDISLKGMQDVHNSIDYVEDFLKLNKFVAFNRYKFYNILEHIKHDILVHVEHSYYFVSIGCGYDSFECNSETLISKLREILDIESLNKPIINH